jgi:hypothetical protein
MFRHIWTGIGYESEMELDTVIKTAEREMGVQMHFQNPSLFMVSAAKGRPIPTQFLPTLAGSRRVEGANVSALPASFRCT